MEDDIRHLCREEVRTTEMKQLAKISFYVVSFLAGLSTLAVNLPLILESISRTF